MYIVLSLLYTVMYSTAMGKELSMAHCVEQCVELPVYSAELPVYSVQLSVYSVELPVYSAEHLS